jgi:hypothetical protein
MNMIAKVLAAAALASLPAMASAVTTTVATDVQLGDAPSVSFSVPTTDDGVIFSFTALNRFAVTGFAVNAVGSNSGADASGTTFSVDGGPPLSFGVVNNFGPVSFAGGFAPGAKYATGDSFTIQFFENAVNDISYGVSFTTSPIPVPAAGLLLLTALGGAAALRRRKKTATA